MAKPALSESAERLYNQLAPIFFRSDEASGWQGALYCSALAKKKDKMAVVVQPQNGKPPFAILLCPQECPEEWLPWLGQFVGIPAVTIEALIKTGKASTARQWIEAPINYLRGRTSAMKLAAEATLTGKKTLYFYVRYSGEAFRIKAASIAGETPSATATREAIEQWMPAWCVLEYETVTNGTLAILEASHPKLSEVEAAHTSLSDMELNPAK